MERRLLLFFVGQALVYQVFTANLHPALQQYILSGLTHPSTLSYPSVTITKQSTPNNAQSLASLASLFSPVSSLPVKQSISPTSLLSSLSPESPYSTTSNLQSLAALAALLNPPKPQAPSPSSILTALTEPSNSASSSIDASLLNNLAIALQLLLVSNLINSPLPETPQEPPSVPTPAYSVQEYKEPVSPVTPISVSYAHTNQQQPVTATAVPPKAYIPSYDTTYNQNYNHYENSYSHMPNANFVGSSTFADSNPFGSTIPAPTSSSRGGFSLMSPYEALSPSSPYSDPILSSPFGSVMTSKKDFQSPYSSILAADNKDLFSMSDFF